jgi:hypothetical protein
MSLSLTEGYSSSISSISFKICLSKAALSLPPAHHLFRSSLHLVFPYACMGIIIIIHLNKTDMESNNRVKKLRQKQHNYL